jgi:hypothetical protein
MNRKFAILLSLFVLLLLTACAAKPSGNVITHISYQSSIVWDNSLYGLSVKEVPKEELGKQLGEVKRKKQPMPEENGDANDTPVGSRIFEIKGISANEAIAVENGDKTYMAMRN